MPNKHKKSSKKKMKAESTIMHQRLEAFKLAEELGQMAQALHNYERPHQGYRNMGRRPTETIEFFKKSQQIMLEEG